MSTVPSILDVHKKTYPLAIDKNHIALTSTETLTEIMMPLLKPHGITVFNYYKIYFDGSVIRLSTDRASTENYFKKNYLEKLTFPKGCFSKPLNYFIWLTEDCPELLLDNAINFDISNGISIAERHADYMEYFAFATTRKNTSIINTFYINNLDILQKYCLYFREQAKNLLATGEKNRILTRNLITDPSQRTDLPNNASKILTNRQLDCASLLLKGKTYKEIATQLNLSPRTVETHLNVLKTKFDCRNTVDLALKLSVFVK
jgi:LuxR family transcriptional regulator, quorum-sensing system regulator SolR